MPRPPTFGQIGNLECWYHQSADPKWMNFRPLILLLARPLGWKVVAGWKSCLAANNLKPCDVTVEAAVKEYLDVAEKLKERGKLGADIFSRPASIPCTYPKNRYSRRRDAGRNPRDFGIGAGRSQIWIRRREFNSSLWRLAGPYLGVNLDKLM